MQHPDQLWQLASGRPGRDRAAAGRRRLRRARTEEPEAPVALPVAPPAPPRVPVAPERHVPLTLPAMGQVPLPIPPRALQRTEPPRPWHPSAGPRGEGREPRDPHAAGARRAG